ncbi:MAG: HNH endonuclease [Spirochaetes bacterium]|nr:HNH endonuclease [Spirochaetota bacterium]
MTYRRDKKRNASRKDQFIGFYGEDDIIIAREKEKARKLRDTSWWRKKCAAGICSYCGQKIPHGELTMDHIIPLSRGGKSERINIVPACKECNNKKKYLLPVEWEEYLDKLSKKRL